MQVWVRRFAGVKRIDKRRMEELRKEGGVKDSLTRKLARSQLKLAGRVERMEGERLSKRVDVFSVEGKRKTETQMGLREERFGGNGRGWIMRARDRGSGNVWWRHQ